MELHKSIYLLALLLLNLTVNAQTKKKDYLVTFQTPYGDIKAVLHDQTPLHKQNFLALVKQGFYDSLLFHRVINKFMIQGGDPNSKRAKKGEVLGNGGGDMPRISAEFLPELFHKKGALAAARDSNPEKKSSACQFYMVQGAVWNDSSLNAQTARIPGARPPTALQRDVYKTLGGSPHLDGNYTVFGQVVSGLAIIDSIAAQPRDAKNRPLKDLRLVVSAKKMRKKKIKKLYAYDFGG
ncbi:MAG: peptidylprolyl isomerase [Runella slithyformis]|nr:MAG: peptidylprolyl isomerase [Runella slithyformis]